MTASFILLGVTLFLTMMFLCDTKTIVYVTENEINNGRQRFVQSIESIESTTIINLSNGKSIPEINIKLSNADELFDGDIILTRDQEDLFLKKSTNRVRRQAMVVDGDHYKLWPRTIYWRYNSNFPESYKKFVKKALEMYSSVTCLKFEAAKGSEALVMEFTHDEGCLSYIGLYDSPHAVHLGNGCDSLRIAIHEIGHALGLWHTHNRIDRDDYVTVEGNGDPTKRSAFGKLGRGNNDNRGVPYDYGSVMHYAENGFGFTLKAKDPLYQGTIGSPFESFYDIESINKLYNCSNNCVGSVISCEHGGYINPNNCSKCLCPQGFSGKNCSEMPAGSELSTLSPGVRVYKTGSNDTILGDELEFVFHHIWIKVPNNTKVKITYKSVSSSHGNLCLDGCTYGGIEIKSKEDKGLTGYRFCCGEKVLLSNSSMIPIIVYRRADTPMEYSFTAETDGCKEPFSCPAGGSPDHNYCDRCSFGNDAEQISPINIPKPVASILTSYKIVS